MAKPKPWYKYPYVADYAAGQDPFGNFPKPDINIECPDGMPITNLRAGTVTGLNSSDGSVPAWGACVTLRLDKPVNEVATHIAYLHLEPIPSFLTIGLHVPAGEVIGYSGGASAQGLEKVPVGVALYNGDIYGFGPTWDLYVGSAWLDPTPVLKAAGNSGTGQSKTAGETITSIAEHIRPDEGVAELLHAMDIALKIQNPFLGATISATAFTAEVPLGPFQVPISVSLPKSISDPFTYIGDVAEGLIQNFSAVFVRSLFIVMGILILYVVVQATMISRINQFLEPVGGISGAVEKGAALA